jgi:LysM repeat protein
VKIPLFFRLFRSKLFFALIAISIPIVAQAGLFSFITASFSTTSAQERTEFNPTVQNMALLQAALNWDPNPSKGGGEINIVNGMALSADTGPTFWFSDGKSGANGGQISMYVVREGDSLSQIASMFNVTTNTIIWANDINGHIKEGQTLIILPMTGVRHIVVAGDTISSIAKKYGGDEVEILAYNKLSANSALSVGDLIDIPDGEIKTPTVAARSGSTGGSTATAGIQGTISQGYYMRPIRGGVRTQGIHGFNAVDLAAPAGTPIFASASGEVIISRNSGWNGGYGNYIVISHPNGTQTLYSHNSQNIVSVGQWVVQGQVIGYVGSSGLSTGPHLHFEIRGGPRNPF